MLLMNKILKNIINNSIIINNTDRYQDFVITLKIKKFETRVPMSWYLCLQYLSIRYDIMILLNYMYKIFTFTYDGLCKKKSKHFKTYKIESRFSI